MMVLLYFDNIPFLFRCSSPFTHDYLLACVDMNKLDNYMWEISICGPASVSTICAAKHRVAEWSHC